MYWSSTVGLYLMHKHPDFTSAIAVEINDHGQIVGYGSTPQVNFEPLIWNSYDSKPAKLFANQNVRGRCRNINNRGQITLDIVGGPYPPGSYFYDPILGLTQIPLPPNQSSQIYGLNDHGDVVGTYFPPNSSYNKAFFWNANLGFVELIPANSSLRHAATSINNSRVITGQIDSYRQGIWNSPYDTPVWNPNLAVQQVPEKISNHGIVLGVNNGHGSIWNKNSGHRLLRLLIDDFGERYMYNDHDINDRGIIAGCATRADGGSSTGIHNAIAILLIPRNVDIGIDNRFTGKVRGAP